MGRSDTAAIVGKLALALIAMASLAANWVFLITDRAWVIMGSPDETYPEFLYMFVGVPLAAAAAAGTWAGLWTSLPDRNKSWAVHPVWWITLWALPLSLLTAAAPFSDSDFAIPEWLGAWIGAGLFFGSPMVMAAQFALVAVAVTGSFGRQRPRAPAPSGRR